MLFQDQCDGGFDRSLEGFAVRIPGRLDSIDGTLQIDHQSFRGGAESVGLGLSQCAMQRGAQGWEKGRQQREPQRVQQQMNQRAQSREPEQPRVEAVNSSTPCSIEFTASTREPEQPRVEAVNSMEQGVLA